MVYVPKPKLLANVPITKLQPSTSTNNIILKGKDTIMGESIIIPMAINTEATTKSTIKFTTKSTIKFTIISTTKSTIKSTTKTLIKNPQFP